MMRELPEAMLLEVAKRSVNELVSELKDKLLQELSDLILAPILGQPDEIATESPIEDAFYVAWRAYERIHETYWDSPELEPQHKVKVGEHSYRLDFWVVPADRLLMMHCDDYHIRMPDIAIELDGHDFHEKTKEQVAHRNERDRELQAAGWTVLHYSGSEVLKDPIGCVERAWTIAKRAFDECRWQVRQIQMAARAEAEGGANQNYQA